MRLRAAPQSKMVRASFASVLVLVACALADEDVLLQQLEHENAQLRGELEQESGVLEGLLVSREKLQTEPAEKSRSAGPRRRLSSHDGEGIHIHQGTVHHFADASTCLGSSGPSSSPSPLTVHDSATGEAVFERGGVEMLRTPTPVSVQVACDGTEPETRLRLDTAFANDLVVSGTLMVEEVDVLAMLRVFTQPPASPPEPPSQPPSPSQPPTPPSPPQPPQPPLPPTMPPTPPSQPSTTFDFSATTSPGWSTGPTTL